MWKSLLCVALLARTAHGYWLSKSDPICRDESFLFFWQAIDGKKQGISPYDVSDHCTVQFQAWFMITVCLSFVFWLFQFIPAVANFIEGVERKTDCCGKKNGRK